MTIPQYLYLYILTIPLVALFDLLWLGFLAKDFYQTRLAYLLGPVHWPGAIIFYCVYAGGIIFFAVSPALIGGVLSKACVLGVLLGLFAYATYDLTNYATVKGWPLSVVVVDILWGMILTGSVSTLSFLLAKHMFTY